jgi:uncharacterized OB-fold protein
MIPKADELSKPFWDAVQERRLVVQHCTSCDRLQYPPRARCQHCNGETLDWKEVEGKGHVLTGGTIEDSHLPPRAADQPFNLVVVTLDEDPRINFWSNLPGGPPPREIPVGAAVEVMFEELLDGSVIHEWKLVE